MYGSKVITLNLQFLEVSGFCGPIIQEEFNGF
jgi:hypothetical protein